MLRIPTRLHRNSGSRRHARRRGITLCLEALEDRTLLNAAALAPAPATNFVDGLYQVLLERKPQPNEDSYWVDRMRSGMAASQVA